MPRASSSKAGTKSKGKGPKAHKLPERFPAGEILSQSQPLKKKWKLGEVIGQGGFGLIYTASDVTDGAATEDQSYVIKIEPLDNGPLFCEFHFYQRVAKPELITEWTTVKKHRYLAVPQFLGSGQHKKNDQQYRFLALQRLSTDLQKIFEQNGRAFSEKTTFFIGLRMLDALEYIHEKGYCHADIKAANILLGYSGNKTDYTQVYLVDYGLAYRFVVDGLHKPYKEDPRRAHDGTCEYASRDAHHGVCPSRRGDLEILGYCMLEWLSGTLPWISNINDKDKVRDLKVKYMNDLPSLFEACFKTKPCPEGLKKYFTVVSKLAYDEKPNYLKLRQFLGSANNLSSLCLSEAPETSTSRKGVKRKSDSATPVTPKARRTSSTSNTPSPPKAKGRGAGSRSDVAITNGRARVAKKQGAGSSLPTQSPSATSGGLSTVSLKSNIPGKAPTGGRPAKVIRSPKLQAAKANTKVARKSPAAKKSPAARKSPAAKKSVARTPQKRKRKAVQSADLAVQTSPGIYLCQNGMDH